MDLPGNPEVPALLDFIREGDLLRRTTIARGEADVHTVEHLTATLSAFGIDNALIELDAPEPPFMDGSAKPFVELVQAAGVVDQQAVIEPYCIPRPLSFRLDDAEIVAIPSKTLRVSFFFSSDEPLLRTQSASFEVTPEAFAHEISPARTFCFFRELEWLLGRGLLRGGSLASSVVIGRKAIINNSLRFDDEPVRHKILDFIGDISLLGKPVAGHFLASRAGHRVNAAFGLFLRKELSL